MTLRTALAAVATLTLATNVFAAKGAWTEDYDAAIEMAKKDNKLVMLEFTGSDWCPPCMQLNDKVLSKDGFQSKAKELGYVLVKLDFPRAEQPKDIKERNAKLAKDWGITGYPTIYITTADLLPVWTTGGYGGQDVDQYVAYLEEAKKMATSLNDSMKKAHEAKGNKKAELIDAAIYPVLSASPSFVEFYKDPIAAMMDAAKGDKKAELKAKYDKLAESLKAKEAITNLERSIRSQEDLKALAGKVDDLMEKYDYSGEDAAKLYMMKAVSSYQSGDFDAAIEAADAGIAADPEGQMGVGLKNLKQQLEVMKAQKEAEEKAAEEAGE